jgi:SAM-dependent methyltransferase
VRVKSWSFDVLALEPGIRALDVGCGTGEDVIAMADLAQPKGRAVGVDISATMIDEARRRHGHRPDVSFQTADAGLLPFESSTFDACRCERTLQHIDVPDAAVAEMARVLRPGGRLALLEPDWGTLIVSGGDPVVTKRILAVHVGRHRQPALGRRLRGFSITHGFTDIELGAGVVMYTDVSSAYRAFGMVWAGALAVRAGVISAQEELRWSADLVKADDDLTFFASVTGFLASGYLPTASP